MSDYVPSKAVMDAARRLHDTGATMSTDAPARTAFAESVIGGLNESKSDAVEMAQELLEQVWRDTNETYNVAPLTGLAIAQKIVNAVLAGAVAEHAKILAEPFSPRQTRMSGT